MNKEAIKSDDVLVIDTTAPTQIKQQTFDPFPVYTEGHPYLKQKCNEVSATEIVKPEFQDVIGRLKATMKAYNAVGMSANQCGINLRLFVLGTDVFQMACVNPQILETKGPLVKKREGCVSFPALFLNVPRYESIKVEYLNENGEKTVTWMDGVTAQCFQHELDHMDGICYTENVGPLAVRMAKERQVKLIKKIKRSMK